MEQTVSRQINGQKFFRQFSLDTKEINKDERTIKLSFASEQEVMQSFGTEKLTINEQSVDLSRVQNGVMPLLQNHSPDLVLGKIKSATITGSRVECLAVFNKRGIGDEIYNNILDDTFPAGVSFGYTIDDYTETDTGIVVNHLSVFEVSVCSIPADSTVGINRELKIQTKKENKAMENEVKEVSAPVISDAEREQAIMQTRSTEIKRISEIDAIASGNVSSTITGIREIATAAKAKGDSVESFRATVLGEIEKRQSPVTSTAKSDFSDSDIKSFSLSRAINAQMTGDYSGAKYEREMMDYAAAKSGVQRGGLYVPYQVLRTLAVSGNEGVVKNVTSSDVISPLYSSSVTAGCTVLTGLQGVVSIPRIDSSFAANVQSEGNAVSETDGTFSACTLTPQVIASSALYSKQLLAQSGGNLDQIIANDMLKMIPIKIESMLLAKILADTGVVATTCGTTLANSHLVNMESKVLGNNANPIKLKYITAPAIGGFLKNTAKVASTAVFISENGMVNGYDLALSSLMTTTTSTGKIIFGDISEAYIGFWGAGIELIVDAISLANKAQVRITASALADVQVRTPAAFTKITDAQYS